MRLEDRQHFEQQVAEVGRVQHLQPRLIGGIEFAALAVRECLCLAGGHLVGREAPVLPAVNMGSELACGPAFLVDAFGLDDLFHQALLVVGVENGEIGAQSRQFRVAAQHLRAQRMKGAEPLHALDSAADQQPDALAHFARRLVGEGHGENLPRPCALRREQMSKPRRQYARLARARAREHQHRPVETFHRLALLRVQPVEPGRLQGAAHGGGGAFAGAQLA